MTSKETNQFLMLSEQDHQCRIATVFRFNLLHAAISIPLIKLTMLRLKRADQRMNTLISFTLLVQIFAPIKIFREWRISFFCAC